MANLMNKERCCDGFAVFISTWFSRSVFFPYALATIRLDCVLNPWDIRCGRKCVTRVSILNDLILSVFKTITQIFQLRNNYA